jgi:soluble lytic murein transglycosylase
MRGPSDRCSSIVPVALTLPSLALVVLLAAATSPAYRVTAEPRTPEEQALRDALAKTAAGAPAASAEALRRVSVAHPGTPSSGLAQLAAGLALVSGQKARESLPFLTHPDVQQTRVADHALLAIGRAQEALQQWDAAAHSYLAAASAGTTPVACAAFPRAAEAFVKAGATELATEPLERAAGECGAGQAPGVLARLGEIHETRGDRRAAALAYDRLDREYPASPEAQKAAPKLLSLASLLPAVPAEERASRNMRKGQALLDVARNTDAAAAFRAVSLAALSEADADLVRVRHARALIALRRDVAAEKLLRAVPAASPHAAETSYQLARIRYRRGRSTEGFTEVAWKFPGTPWAEEALLQLANEYQKDARDEEAVPYWRRIFEQYPEGRYAERACWRVSWSDYRAGRYELAAQSLEKTARVRPPSNSTAGFLYWAGRARAAQGQTEAARALYEEAEKRYRYGYHGLRAGEALSRMPAPTSVSTEPSPTLQAAAPAEGELPETQEERVRQLLLIDQLEAAQDELRPLPFSRRGQATMAWIDWRRGRLRPAIVSMKKAFPEYIAAAGESLPDEVWRVLYPIEFEETLKAKAGEEGLDPALVAALILQESTFDAGALSRAGARGLMQVMPATGRKLARDLSVRYRRAALHDPQTSLDFGTRYLRQMSDRFDGAVERMLAAYNAGPHRVDAWTAVHPGLTAEEFIETIPFTETRYYVMIILAGREQYRRLYGLEKPTASATAGARP